VTCLLTRLS